MIMSEAGAGHASRSAWRAQDLLLAPDAAHEPEFRPLWDWQEGEEAALELEGASSRSWARQAEREA